MFIKRRCLYYIMEIRIIENKKIIKTKEIDGQMYGWDGERPYILTTTTITSKDKNGNEEYDLVRKWYRIMMSSWKFVDISKIFRGEK